MHRIAGIALLSAISLLIGLFTGCGVPSPSVTTTTESSAVSATSASTATTATSAALSDPDRSTQAGNLNPPGTLPVCKETDTLRVVLAQSPHVMSYEYGPPRTGANALTVWLQDRTNVAVEFILYPEQNATADLETDLSSGGDLGDLILIQMDRAKLFAHGRSGALLPLNNLIDQYGYAMKECLDSFDGSREAITAPDGNIYALPKGGLTGITPNAYAMRQWVHTDFLGKYTAATGSGTPATTDEFERFLAWCVTSDPNSNGKNDEVGWTGSEKTAVWYARPTGFLMNAFTPQNQDGYYQQDEIIHCAMVEDGYRDGLKYLARLMAEGLMDPNWPNNDENVIKALVALEGGNTVASISCGGMHNAANDHKIRNAYQVLAPLQGPTGLQNAFYDHYSTGVTPGKATIPASGGKPDLAVAWMDTMYDQEVCFRSQNGEPGVDWEIPPAGTLATDGGPALYHAIRNQWSVPLSSNWFTSGPAMWNRNGTYTQPLLPKTDVNGNPIHNLELSLYNASRLYEDYVIPCSIPPFFFDPSTATKTDEWKSAIDTYCRTAITDYIFGRRNINDDADWAAYVAGARALGLDDYLQTMQDNYDANWKGTLPDVYEKKPFRTA